jgi:LmbE family N-acetylglucosaminyl deacetylase
MKVLVVAPHADDEVLGVGGSILRMKSEGCSVALLSVTGISTEHGWRPERVERRENENKKISDFFEFDEAHYLGFPPARLDSVPLADLVRRIGDVVNSFGPEMVFLPWEGDVHSDHKIVSQAVTSCTKWFRYPTLKRVLAYETLSETEFSSGGGQAFSPNVFIDISGFLEKKLEAMEIYESEVADFPFPRSRDSIEALARFRGSSSGFMAAEAFLLLKERL